VAIGQYGLNMYALDVYNELVKLKDDPVEFAKRRKEIIDDMIAESPDEYQEKLSQQCWCLDKKLNKYKDPVARMNKMVEIFWQGVYKFEDILRTGSIAAEPRTNADVIPFKKK